MTRRKNHRRTRRKQEVKETLDHSSRDPSCFVMNKSDADIGNNSLDSTLEVDQHTPDPNLRTPETVMDNSQTSIDPLYYKDLSPKIIGKVPKIKLDLDIPDCDTEPIVEIEPAKLDLTLENVKSEKLSSADKFPDLENIKVQPIDTKLDDYLLDKTVSIDNTMKFELETERTRWSENSYSTANSLPTCNIPVTVFSSVNRTRSKEKNCHSHDFNYENKQNDSERHVLEKNTFTGSKSQANHTNNRHFMFEGTQKPGYHISSETLLIEDANWHEGNQILSSMEQLKILKTVSEPETLRAQKYRNQKHSSTNSYSEFGKPQSMYSGDENAYYLTNTDMNDEMNCSRSSSPPAKRSRTALRFENETRPKTISSITHPPAFNFLSKGTISLMENDSNYAKALKTPWSSSSISPTSVELPTVSDLDGKASGSEMVESQVLCCEPLHTECIHCIQTTKPHDVQVHVLTIPFIKITEFCSWLAKKLVELLRKGSTWFRETMTMNVQQQSAQHPDTSVFVNDLSQLFTSIRCDNDHTVSILSEKVTHLSEELVQVRVHSETTLAMLATELTGMREANNILTDQLKSLHSALDKIQSKPSSPPPPPPPPPPPLPSQPLTPTTPNSSRSIRTPNRKCSTPLQQSRPTITVEDLLKVTLKKAPRNVKVNKSNMTATPRGPAVSLDMLRSVKLKSARRRSIDQNSRSPRSMSLSMRSRPPPSLTLSPIMSGKESPLGRILRQVDPNKRGSKRALSSPTHSEADLTKDSPHTFSIARHSKSHTVML